MIIMNYNTRPLCLTAYCLLSTLTLNIKSVIKYCFHCLWPFVNALLESLISNKDKD